MFIPILITVFIISLYLYYKYADNKRKIPNNLKEIPIEKGLPIIGILHQIEAPLAFYLLKLGKRHGSFYKIKLGMRDIIVLNDYNIIKKTLKDDGDNFSGRFSSKLVDVVTHNSGILFRDGENWSKQRSFILKVLRDFGLGKSKSLEIVQTECNYLLEELKRFDEQCIDFSKIIPVYTANIISKFIMNKRFERDDPMFHFIDKLMTETLKEKDIVQLLFLMFPMIEDSKWFCKFIMFINSKWKMFDEVHNKFSTEIKTHMAKLDLNSEGEDLIDRFLIEQHLLKEKYGTSESFTHWQLIRNSFELFIAGYETTSTTLGWSLMFMSKYPEIQEIVHNEIIDHIGSERSITMNDKKSLNYTQAVMDEILRLSTVAPLAINHKTFTDTSIDGFYIPKNSVIFPNLLACHLDGKVWEKPLQFYPRHFLSSDNVTEYKYSPREELIPFGIGKRQCLGESLARMEFFIFFTSIIQQFQVKTKDTISDLKFDEIIRANDGFIRFSMVTDFTFIKRQ